MTISFYRSAVTLILITVLSGCSWFGKDEPEYLDSTERAPLKIPEGLDDPKGVSSVVISAPGMRMPAGDELEPMPPRVVRSEGKQDAYAQMIWSADGVYLVIRDTPESVTKKLRVAIENSGMALLEQDDSGALRFQYEQPKSNDEGFFSSLLFWRKNATDHSGTYLTSRKADGDVTRVYLLLGTGESADLASSEQILEIIMEGMD